MIALLLITFCILSGVIGYFICYIQNEKKSDKSENKYNPWAWHQPYYL